MRFVLGLIVLAAPFALIAETRPQPGIGDPRIQTVLYDPDQVVQLQVSGGYQLTVELGAGERIENIAVGDSVGWQVTPNKRGDHLFIKAASTAGPTDLTVVTDSRTYVFALTAAFDTGADLAFTVRFRYPSPTPVSLVDKTITGAVRYRISGARAVRPASVTDDGAHTTISFGDDQSMPAVFAVDAEGHERLIDGSIRDGRYVIDGVAPRLVFRSGKALATATRLVAHKAH